jgi:hypothetical protein
VNVTELVRSGTRRAGRHELWVRFVSVTGTRSAARLLVTTGLGGTLLATALVITLHLLPNFGGVNPMHGMLSDYALRPDGWMFTSALVIIGVGSLALWALLTRHHVLRGWLPMTIMALWCAGLVGIAIFSKDRVETHQTLHGGVHLWVTVVACGALPAVGLLLGVRHRRHRHWRKYALTSFCLALANVPCLLPFVIAFFLNVATHSERFSGPATGLVERVMGGLDIVSLLVLGVWSYAAARNRRAVLLAKQRGT